MHVFSMERACSSEPQIHAMCTIGGLLVCIIATHYNVIFYAPKHTVCFDSLRLLYSPQLQFTFRQCCFALCFLKFHSLLSKPRVCVCVCVCVRARASVLARLVPFQCVCAHHRRHHASTRQQTRRILDSLIFSSSAAFCNSRSWRISASVWIFVDACTIIANSSHVQGCVAQQANIATMFQEQ